MVKPSGVVSSQASKGVTFVAIGAGFTISSKETIRYAKSEWIIFQQAWRCNES